MSYREYVIAAYAVFALMLAWDYIAPRLAIARQLRAARRLAARRAARPAGNTRPTELGR
ncbi:MULTISPECIES: heme exporter protein CcmD [unclassified Luteimonas]|uniref:heme exporter protein CcmD n=1 Tax=unclassified Luteimonas TaxID=2629088 RepID=UPI0018F0C15F|nr:MULTISPECIES: heme exporter protein CcmD [unclassified Luteimonas]MBJ6979262.1 heme exporter protein CcmD [Luteimonas sp. MC1895]MBJ6984525.1 heme exporter protein CcmD [Luteimonas sp. MC1750]QQO04865.1 heme exporter protein CcmD [Luteimonas sp. MC1750]